MSANFLGAAATCPCSFHHAVLPNDLTENEDIAVLRRAQEYRQGMRSCSMREFKSSEEEMARANGVLIRAAIVIVIGAAVFIPLIR